MGKAEAPTKIPAVAPGQQLQWSLPSTLARALGALQTHPRGRNFQFASCEVKLKISSERAIHVLMLSWDGPITPNSFFSSQEEQQDSGSNLANCASKAKQNHRLTYELRQPALQAQKEKTIFVEKGLF